MEVSCARCQRRYAVADHKVVGRRRTSRCRCGNLLIFDGRTLSGGGLDADTSDGQPLEPTLTPSGAPAETDTAPYPEAGGAPAPPVTAAPSAEPQSLAAEAPADSQSIGRIRLRKAELQPAEAVTEGRRSSAPSTRVDSSESAPPISPRSLHEAIDSLDLDRLAESIRPIWEAPASRRVTSPDANPEVIVHYPPEWQPPPSERRRMRASWEVTPTLPLSFALPPSDTLDDDWEPPARDSASTSAPHEAPAPATAAAPSRGEQPAAAEIIEPIAAIDSITPPNEAEPAPKVDARVGQSGGPGIESTAPSAVSQPPPAAPRFSGAKRWAAGLAAAALVALVWRGSGSPTDPSVAGADAPAPAALDGAPARSDSYPAEPAPASDTAEALGRVPATIAPSTAPAAVPSAPIAAVPIAPAAPPAPVTPAPLPGARRTPAATMRPPETLRRHAPTGNSPAPPAVPAPASGAPPSGAPSSESMTPAPEAPSAEPAGPDAGAVARALSAAAARARSCSASDASAGDGSIRILLNPSGGVLNATALGALQGTATGACVENAFRSAETPAYGGRSLSTVYPFSLIVD